MKGMIYLKYEEDKISRNDDKKSTGLIIAIAIAIIIVAAAAWFALSRLKSGGTGDMVSDMKSDLGSMYDDTKSDIKSDISSTTSDIKSDISSNTSNIKSEYNSAASSYNSNISSITSSGNTMPTGDNVSSVPYEKTFTLPCEGKILKAFSDKELVYSKTFGDMRLHSGVDIACKKGTSVSACGDGKIIGIDESSQYGTVVSLELSDGITAKYASLKDLKVKLGDKVKSGDILGVTTTVPAECNDEEHLHFEIYENGIATDPFETLNLNN